MSTANEPLGLLTWAPGSQRLKERLEIDAVLSYATGERVLEVRSETTSGAARRLAARGQRLTGVDHLPSERLPFADDSFDSLIALNVLTRSSPWRPPLPEWMRVVRPGGRLVFDLLSLDHQRAALEAQRPNAERSPGGVIPSLVRASAEELVAEADHHGLAICQLMPYGAFLGGVDRNLWLGSLEDKHYWARLLSWLGSDEALFAFALFLEQELVARLTPTVTSRFMAVLEKRADREGNQAWLEQNRSLDRRLRETPIDPRCLTGRLHSPEAWRRRASELVTASLRGRRLLECLAEKLVAEGRVAWSDILEAPLDAYFRELAAKRADDRLVTELARRASQDVETVAAALDYQGMNLGEGLEYCLVERLLTQGLGRFTGARS